MLFQQRFLEGIEEGSITLAFRRWRRPSVRSGGTLLTPVGQLEIVSVEPIGRGAITAAEARRAGFPSLSALLEVLDRRPEGEIYRIELGALRPDPRIALRERRPDEQEAEAIVSRLERLDRAAADGAWTTRALELIDRHPGVRAGDLCTLMGMDRDPFKRNVRKLKRLALTESLEVGYRLSPRGRSVLRALTTGKRGA